MREAAGPSSHRLGRHPLGHHQPTWASVFLHQTSSPHQTPPVLCSFPTQSLGNLRAATLTLAAAAMAFFASTAAASLRAPLHPASSFRRRPILATAVKATANSESKSPHPILSSLRLAASAAVLLAATSPALACAPSPSPPAPVALTDTASPDDPVAEDDSHPFEELIAETAALVRSGDADQARARLSSAASWVNESCAGLLAAQTLFVDGKVEEAIAAFEELAQKDPSDYRPLFCQGMLYSALGRTEESVSALERCREVAGDKFVPDFSKVLSPADDAAVADAEAGAETAEADEVTA